jgi:cobalt-zinc-cadmium resistance protein CzcA
MLNQIIGFSIRNKLIIGLFTLALIGLGIYELRRLPIDAVPDITDNQVQVITIAPSLGAGDIERLVTFPIEQANSNISGIKEIRSFSRFGLSLITIVFNDETDVYWARQQVAERLQQVRAEIPEGVGNPELGPISTGLGEIYQYIVKAKPGYEQRYDATQLRTIQDWLVRRQLLGVAGVAEVSSFGGKLKQFEVAVDPTRLQALQVNINEVFDALNRNNENTGGAYIEKGPTVLFIRSEGLIGTKDDIASIPIKNTPGGRPILINDIGTVQEGHATRFGAICYNDQGEAAGAVVMMLKGANSSDVIQKVKARIEQIKKTLPEGVEIEPFLDRTKMVNHAIGTVEKNLLEGALIVVFILVLFLGQLRAGLLVASVIPLSMLFAVIMMNAFGVSGNLMSLGALDFGLIVDGAVIIVEAVMHSLSHSRRFVGMNKLSSAQMDETVHRSAGRMMNSAVFGQLIILIVYLPIFTLQGIEGKMFKPMAQTVAFALLGAFLLSLTYIPMMSALLLSKKLNHQPNRSERWMNVLSLKYKFLLARVLRFPKLVLGSVALLFLLAALLLTRMGGEFIPALEEGDFAVDTRVLTGSNLNTSIEYTQKAAALLLKTYPEVEKVVTKIGSGEVPTDPMPMEAADMMVILKDKDAWTSAKGFPELAEKMGNTLSEIPGITTGFQYPVQMRFNELMTGARQDVVCKIFGENLDTLAAYAEKLGALVQRVRGAADLYVEPITGMPQLVIRYKREMLAQYNLDIAALNRTVHAAFAGQEAGKVYEGERRFGLVVRLSPDARSNAEDIANLLVPTATGQQIPLHQVADVQVVNGPNQIQREDAKRRIVVGFNVRGRDVQSIVQELQQKTEQQLRLPSGYYVTYGGAFENLEEAKQRLSIAVPVSLLLIFILLYFAFSSIKQGLLIYTAIPLSAIGGVFLLSLRGLPFSISAGVGFIALFGVAVLNGIVLIAEFNRLKETGLNNLPYIVLRGAALRLRPVLMTATVASLGFLPMALSNGAGAEVQRPLATVVIGGLLLATLLTLFVLPLLYILSEKGFNLRGSKALQAVLLLFLSGGSLFAQSPASNIGLQAALDSALKNSFEMKNARLMMLYREQLQGMARDIPATDFNLEAGQLNSIYTDNRFGISQSFSLPRVYQQKRALLQAEYRLAETEARLSALEVKQAATALFYHLRLLEATRRILLEGDSLLREAVALAGIRLNLGEGNALELASAEVQQGQLKNRLLELDNELMQVRSRFGLLLNLSFAAIPEPGPLLMDPPAFLPDTTRLRSHPLMNKASWQQQWAINNLQVARNQRLPELRFGYNNMSIRGIGADNQLYAGSYRFSSAQLGIGIALLGSARSSGIRAAGTMLNMEQMRLQRQQQELRAAGLQALRTYQNVLSKLNNYQNVLIPSANKALAAAQTQWRAGAINFLEWLMLYRQFNEVQTEYLNQVKEYNRINLQIQYLNNQ